MPSPLPEDPVVRSARREALIVLVTWMGALAYTVGYCWLNGYGRTMDDIRFVHLFGGIAFPDWVFWGIVVPWSVCFVISFCFSYVIMSDANLGEELDETGLEKLAADERRGGSGAAQEMSNG